MSSVVEVELEVIAVRAVAIGSRFLTRWLISPARSSWPSSACLRPVASRKMPNITAPTIPWSSP